MPIKCLGCAVSHTVFSQRKYNGVCMCVCVRERDHICHIISTVASDFYHSIVAP
jgi:hypothetical protein